MKVIKHLLFFMILVTCNNSFAQKQNNQWRFGFGGALDFNTLPPSFVNGSVIATSEGSASVADRITGALLFYTDGVTVWNANNQVMPNGTGLLGGVAQLSSTTAAVIVPKPGSSNLFFIVTVDEIPCINGVRYSVVDMTLNGGLGDIVVGQKNIFLMQTTSEKLEVVPACDGLSLWLIACSSNNEFVSFRIDNTGIQTTPVIGAVFQNGFAGHNKINRQFNKIAVGCCTQMEVFDFDNATGIVSNPIVWNANLPSGLTWGIEFSPDGKVLYTSDGSSLLQFDLTQTTPLAIQNSEYLVSYGVHYTLQLGIDEKIYCNSGSISAINFPNNLGVACGYQANVIPNQTGGVFGASSLPKWVCYANNIPNANSNSIAYSDSCFGSSTQFSLQSIAGITNVNWLFGDPNSGGNNMANGFNVSHSFSQIGNYNVRAILSNECGADTLFINNLQILNCNVNPPPCIASFDVQDTCAISPTRFSIASSATINSVVWNFGDAESGVSNTSSLLNPTHQFTSEGNFNVTAIVAMTCGNYIVSQNVQIFKCDTARFVLNQIFVPEAFSPNSDGNNDKVFVRGSIKDFTFSVFNRWGEVVYRTQNQSTGWDGTFRNRELDAGVFVYYLSGTDDAGNTINKKGNITLVK